MERGDESKKRGEKEAEKKMNEKESRDFIAKYQHGTTRKNI